MLKLLYADCDPPSTPPRRYREHVGHDVPFDTLARQLLVWCAKSHMIKSRARSIGKSDADMLERNIAHNIQKKAIQRLLSEEFDIYLFQALAGGASSKFGRKPNPVNEKNRQRLAKYNDIIEEMDREKQQWKQASSDVFQYHAATFDSAPNFSEDGDQLELSEQELACLDDQERAFLQHLTKERPQSRTHELAKDIDKDITALRQVLNTVNQFRHLSGSVADRILAKIADQTDWKSQFMQTRSVIQGFPTGNPNVFEDMLHILSICKNRKDASSTSNAS
ncbi:hypothetical protein EC973_008503 [Apophysomyces ossiformis]|uniref:Uncharacterized protein n=1 Tax=Apophysomyces ossiformis TaxID=679940 RepID=A0A8H7BNJ2_9FUNG|nr:hypothetical protein EC973_008503 [Apophysomyces ossiformis]